MRVLCSTHGSGEECTADFIGKNRKKKQNVGVIMKLEE
jgi:hypothetical protein